MLIDRKLCYDKSMEAPRIPDDPTFQASFRRSGDIVDIYRIWTDGPILRIDAGGIWDIMATRSYTRDIEHAVSQWRSERPYLRAIVDRSQAPIFDGSVSDLLLATYNRILKPGDRVAMIVDSSLIKQHIRRIADREETEMFLSIAAARTWLLAHN